MLKKFAMVSVGVTAGLMAIAPMASATEGHHEDKSDNRSCEFDAGDASGEAETSVESLGAAAANSIVTVAGGSNTLNTGNCSDILTDNLNDNQLNGGTIGSSNEK